MPKSARTIRPVDPRDIDLIETLMGWDIPLPMTEVSVRRVLLVPAPARARIFSKAA